MIDLSLQKKIGNIEIDVSFSCQKKKTLSLIGESGAGKTTLLRLIAGLERPEKGYINNNEKILFSSDDKINIPSHKRQISYVFQEYTLFPHWSIEKNILYTAQNREFARELIEHFKISHIIKRKPDKASGGERQRAAFAQAIAREPELLLLDEPFSSLDTKNRRTACEFLFSLKERINCPVILVTHDESEAFFLGDRVLEMDKGRIKNFKEGQNPTPLPLRKRPLFNNQRLIKITG